MNLSTFVQFAKPNQEELEFLCLCLVSLVLVVAYDLGFYKLL